MDRRSPQDLSDDEARRLVRGIRRGDRASFEEFYEMFFDVCVAHTAHITRRDESFCLDVVQDLMLLVVDRLPRLATARALSSWLRRALYTRAVDHLRAAQRSTVREQHAAKPEISEAPGPLEQAAHEESLTWLQAELEKLGESERALVVARYRDARSLEASGARIGIGGDAAHGRIRRTVDRLRRAWRAHAELER